MEFQDHYEVLNVPPTATHEQIERAYKRLVTISHPDLFPHDLQAQAWANERMKQINEAYEVLKDPERRAAHDRTHAQQKASRGGRQQEQRQEYRQRQQYREPRVPCPLCEQHGRIPCLTCEGRGDAECPGCHGTQVTICPLCKGVGTLTEAEAREFHEAWERSQQQAAAEAARQEAEAAGRRQAEAVRRERENRRRIAMAGVGVLALLFVARSCTADSGRPVISSPVSVVAQPTPYRRFVQPVPQRPQERVTPAPPSLRSIHSQVPTELTFRNETSNPVQVLWIDYNGREVLYRTLVPGESYVQSTYATHPWRLRDAVTGRTLQTMVAGSNPSQVVVGQPRRPPPVAKQVSPRAAVQTPRLSVAAANDQAQADSTKVQVTEPASTSPVQRGPTVRFLTELSPVLQLQSDLRTGGILFGQPYQFAVVHVNRAGLLMRTVYNLDGQYDRFEVTVGMEGTGNLLQQAVAKVYGDGQLLFESPGLGLSQTAVKISVSVKGVSRLELQTTGLPVVMTIVWADPKLFKE